MLPLSQQEQPPMASLATDVYGSPAWQLRGETERVVVCLVDGSRTSSWTVQVIRADEPLLWETYPDQASAMRRADAIRDTLIAKGWRDVPSATRPDHLLA